MNVSKLNPIGYTAKTPDGQEYKKSNIGKTAIIANTCLGLRLQVLLWIY